MDIPQNNSNQVSVTLAYGQKFKKNIPWIFSIIPILVFLKVVDVFSPAFSVLLSFPFFLFWWVLVLYMCIPEVKWKIARALLIFVSSIVLMWFLVVFLVDIDFYGDIFPGLYL